MLRTLRVCLRPNHGESATDGELTFECFRVYRSVAQMSDCRGFAILLSDSNKRSWTSAVSLLSCPSPLQVVSRKIYLLLLEFTVYPKGVKGNPLSKSRE